MSKFSYIKIILIITITFFPKINTQSDTLFTTYKKGTPGEYLGYDDYFENENYKSSEKYHYITAAWAANSGYVDEYSGLYYNNIKCSWREYDHYSSDGETIELTKLNDNDVQKTNLIGLLTKGCVYNESYNNFAVWQYQNSNDDISYSVIIRFANPFDHDISMEINTCSGYYYSNCNPNTKNVEAINAHSILKYTIKWDKTHIIYINNNNENNREFEQIMQTKGFIYFKNLNPYIIEDGIESKTLIYINSVVFRAEMFKYKLSLSGDSMNYCYNNGCHSGYYCNLHYTIVDDGIKINVQIVIIIL